MDDMIVIRGLAQSLRDKSITAVMEDVNIDPDTDHPLVSQEHILHPENIMDPDIFKAYNQLRLDSIWDRLTDKALEPPEKDKVAAYDERANREYVMTMLTEFQEMLDANPEMKALKWAYVVEEQEYDQVVDKVMVEIGKIKAYETERKTSRGEMRKRVERNILGYKGPVEGYSLDVEHILMDALQNVTKQGADQKPRSYSDISRFISLRDLKDHLEQADRSYFEITIFDPTNDKHSSIVSTAKADESGERKAVVQHEKDMAMENLKRAEARLEQLIKRHSELSKVAKEERDTEEEAEYRSLQSQLSGFHGGLKALIQRLKDEARDIENRKRNELAPLQGAMKDIRGHIARAGIDLDPKAERGKIIQGLRDTSAKYQVLQVANRGKLLEAYKQLFSKDWDSFTLREVKRSEANIMKMIYVLTPEGDVIVEEERIRGSADSGRAAHSELAQGRNIYAAGELAFEKKDGKWQLTEINSGSGHYRPSQDTLAYAKAVISRTLGLDPNDANIKTRNCIFRGVDIDGLPLDFSYDS